MSELQHTPISELIAEGESLRDATTREVTTASPSRVHTNRMHEITGELVSRYYVLATAECRGRIMRLVGRACFPEAVEEDAQEEMRAIEGFFITLNAHDIHPKTRGLPEAILFHHLNFPYPY